MKHFCVVAIPHALWALIEEQAQKLDFKAGRTCTSSETGMGPLGAVTGAWCSPLARAGKSTSITKSEGTEETSRLIGLVPFSMLLPFALQAGAVSAAAPLEGTPEADVISRPSQLR
jgi:hypothetical protein